MGSAASHPAYAARQIFASFGLDADDEGAFRTLAEALIEEGVVSLVTTSELPCDALLQKNLWGHWEILVRGRLPLRRREFAIAHELAEWWLSEDGYREPDVEALADAIAGALVGPPSVRRCGDVFEGD